MKHRCKIVIIISLIVEAANAGGATKTMILYSAFLSYNQLILLLKLLTESDLLSYDLNSRTFKTTENGLRFLEIYTRSKNTIVVILLGVINNRKKGG
ncbi:MAG TPA: winged helix-turn-helix domain-containing protein [Nitrososphaeraceae archaeon]|nr:winged helix-turn-helix domain-containing protein [Nitrososphaeraceae archaeon]